MEFDVLHGFRLGAWEVYPQLNRLVSKQGNHTLEGKVMAVLVELARNSDQVLSKNALLDAVWPNQAVAEGVLTRAIHELRHALGDPAHESVYIENVPRLGYRLLHRPEPIDAPLVDIQSKRRRRAVPAVFVAVIALAAIMYWQLPQNGASSSQIASVAVLPFTNLTGDASKDYVSDGLAEEVIHLIAQQPQISVAARTSSFALRDLGLSAEEIGSRLGVDSIFEGSIREERGVQRITVQLINVASGGHLGSVTLDVVDGDLFDAQERIGNTIVAMLSDAGAPVDRNARTTMPATEARAYDLYLKGRAALQTRSTDSLQNAQAYFEEALRYDEQFAPVYAGLAQLYFISQFYLQADAEQADSLAQRTSANALRLDPNNVDALLVSAVLDVNHGNLEEAMATFNRALELQPGNAQAHQWYGETLLSLGYTLAAYQSIERALRLNPLAGSTNSVMAKAASYFPGDNQLFTTATQAGALGARLAPRLLSLHYFRSGDFGAFARELRRYYEVIGVDPVAAELLQQALSGRLSKSDLAVNLEPLSIARDAYFARELALLGMPSETMVALLRRSGLDGAFFSDIWLPEFQPVRALPKFVDFIRSLGMHDYWRDHGLPDVCNGGQPEPFCDYFSDSADI